MMHRDNTTFRFFAVTLPILLAFTGCQDANGISRDTQPFAGIGEGEAISLAGTEPFWSIAITGNSATYSSPEMLEGETFKVARFQGNNGLGFSGELQGEKLQITVTPGACSDGMSDRTYPFTATVLWGDQKLLGCGHTDVQGFTGPVAP